ncbi:MAG TPA: ABC transporter ATP-binding protein [Xanthomonadales bacterium]|nr:ABC transporter ATP-binding protein [Xanthomonadales bacterium]
MSLSLAAGEVVAIVGESGCGKSSFVRALLGLLPTASGAVLYRGQDISTLDKQGHREWLRETQLIFQDPHSALSPRRRIRQTLEEALQQRGSARGAGGQQRILAVLDEVNLAADVLQRYPHQLSGGQKQRIALARALLCEPSLVIADEPLSALDVSEQARLLQLIRQLREEKNIAFLLIAHDLAMVQQIADRVGVMYLGRLVELAPAALFFCAAAHPYSQALLQSTRNNWNQVHTAEPSLEGEPPSALSPPPGCVFHTRCRQRLEQCSHIVPDTRVLSAAGSESLHQVQCHLYAGQHSRNT